MQSVLFLPVQCLLNCFRGSCGFFTQSITSLPGWNLVVCFSCPCALFTYSVLLCSHKFLFFSLFDILSPPIWQYAALSFLTERNARLACIYCCVTLQTYFLQASIALHRSAPSAYSARNVRVLIASSKKSLFTRNDQRFARALPSQEKWNPGCTTVLFTAKNVRNLPV